MTNSVCGTVAVPVAAAARSLATGSFAAGTVSAAVAATVTAAVAATVTAAATALAASTALASAFGVGRRGVDGDAVIGEIDAERHDCRDQRDRAAARKQG